jgi:hypothetical protein
MHWANIGQFILNTSLWQSGVKPQLSALTTRTLKIESAGMNPQIWDDTPSMNPQLWDDTSQNPYTMGHGILTTGNWCETKQWTVENLNH